MAIFDKNNILTDSKFNPLNFFLMSILLLLCNPAIGQTITQADTTSIVNAETINNDVFVDSLTATSPMDMLDSTFVTDTTKSLDSLSIAQNDSLFNDTLDFEPYVPDSTHPHLPVPTDFQINQDEFSKHGYRSSVDLTTLLPGLFKKHVDLFAQPAYPIVPGGSGRDLRVVFNNRPYDDPITDAANLNTFAVEELFQIFQSNAWNGIGFSNSGPVITLQSPYSYSINTVTRIVYRQGLYGVGNADWRISQQVTNEFAYHFGLNIGEYVGRYTNTEANTSLIRLGGNKYYYNIGLITLNWMQTRLDHGRARLYGNAKVHRNDLDLIVSSGHRDNPNYRELGLWYVRMQRGYSTGSEDGNRVGGRFVQNLALKENHMLIFRADLERTALHIAQLTQSGYPEGSRLVGGISMMDRIDLSKLKINTSIRSEYYSTSSTQDTISSDSEFLVGGSFAADYGNPVGIGLQSLLSSSWRWPSLDESFGYWHNDAPERWMEGEIYPVHSIYQGNPDLKPVKTNYGGLGLRYNFNDNSNIKIMAGIRNWDNPIDNIIIADTVLTKINVSSLSVNEFTANGNVHLIGPFSVAGSYTWTDAPTYNKMIPEYWGWESLRFDDSYYNGNLVVKLSLTHRHLSESTYAGITQEATSFYDGLIRMRIGQFEAFIGNNNYFSEYYTLIPNYKDQHKTEIWGVRWILFD
jgi:hypothetical protein